MTKLGGAPKSKRLVLDETAESASASEPAFIARPEGAPVYHGFRMLDDVEVEGFRFGLITEIGPGISDGDAFVVAPDGSRAGIVWDLADELRIRQVRDFEPERWGVWSIGFAHPLENVEDVRHNLALIVPELRGQWKAWDRWRASRMQ